MLMRTRGGSGDTDDHETEILDIEDFLRSIERRGFLMARVALGNDDDALDVLQDTMMRLVQRYAKRPPAEWRPLFYRMLHNRITDTYRRRSLNARLFGWLGRGNTDEDAEQDLIEQIADPAVGDPARLLASADSAEAISAAVAGLPPRQQQAFMLRCWEGLSTADTANAMGCTEGSVKTHYSRAIHALREKLEDHWS
jgi:RNA polymerase sigma-70 factor, ECF subfamily